MCRDAATRFVEKGEEGPLCLEGFESLKSFNIYELREAFGGAPLIFDKDILVLEEMVESEAHQRGSTTILSLVHEAVARALPDHDDGRCTWELRTKCSGMCSCVGVCV